MPYVQHMAIFLQLGSITSLFLYFLFFLHHVSAACMFQRTGPPHSQRQPHQVSSFILLPLHNIYFYNFLFVLFHPTPRPANNKLLLFTTDCLILYIYEHACLGRRQCLKMWRIFKSVQVDCTQEHQRIYQVVQGRLWNRFVTVIMTLVTT